MSTLTKKITLIFSDAGSADGVQHNKVWNGELFDDGLVKTSWGRVGYSLQSKEFPGAGESFLLSKQAEKIRKGYTEAKIIDVLSSKQTSTAPVTVVNNLHEIAKKQIARKSSNPVLDQLIDRLVKSNVHKITSSTNIVLNDATGLFQTPLGIVAPDAISEARTILADTISFVNSGNFNEELNRLVGKYLRLIPQNIGMKFDVRKILPDVSAVQKQNDILDSLEASYQALTKTPVKSTGTKKTEEQVFQVDLDIASGIDASRLERWYESSKKSQHGYDRIKVKNVFKVNIRGMTDDYVDDNSKEVFHGTSEANCLSILKSGLKVSPPATTTIAGKMWGNGVYGAINSSKSLGYTFGRWGQSSGGSGWLFICQFALGKVHYPRGYGNCSRPPNGHDSIWATVANTGLQHDELIIYNNNRVKITHLIECK